MNNIDNDINKDNISNMNNNSMCIENCQQIIDNNNNNYYVNLARLKYYFKTY